MSGAPLTILGVECKPIGCTCRGTTTEWRGETALGAPTRLRVQAVVSGGGMRWTLSATWARTIESESGPRAWIAHTIDASGATLGQADARMRELMAVHLPDSGGTDGTERAGAVVLFVAWTEEIGCARAAEILGCDPSFISHVRSGKKRPSLDTAAALERATRDWPMGPIRATEWAHGEPGAEAQS